MNTYYLRELRKEAFHTYKIIQLHPCGYRIINTKFEGCPHVVLPSLKEAKEQLKALRADHIKGRLIELKNEKRYKWL